MLILHTCRKYDLNRTHFPTTKLSYIIFMKITDLWTGSHIQSKSQGFCCKQGPMATPTSSWLYCIITHPYNQHIVAHSDQCFLALFWWVGLLMGLSGFSWSAVDLMLLGFCLGSVIWIHFIDFDFGSFAGFWLCSVSWILFANHPTCFSSVP